MARTAFVTGATGFVGLNLVDALLGHGWDVIAFHRASSDISGLQRFRQVKTVIGDITDARSIRDAMPRNIDCVFHTAGNTSLWIRDQVEQIKVNARGTRNVARAALENGAKRLVHTSSIVAYGVHSGVITEETPTRGSAVEITHIRSKAMAEREVRRLMSSGLPAVIVNPSNLIGRYDTHSWARFFRLIKQGRLPLLPPGGGSFCHARNAAQAMVAAAERGQLGHNYLLGGAQASYVGLAQTVARELGLKRRFTAVNPAMLTAYAGLEEWIAPLFGREPDVTRGAVDLLSKNFYCSSRKAEQELGYRPIALEEMVRDCANWMRGAGQL
ncbi:MAG TPA: NAD-dependent epimerase/dehydratase family protein [Fontimonas sp.]